MGFFSTGNRSNYINEKTRSRSLFLSQSVFKEKSFEINADLDNPDSDKIQIFTDQKTVRKTKDNNLFIIYLFLFVLISILLMLFLG